MPLPNFQTQFSGPSEIFRGQWAHTVSSTLVNELRLSYTNINFSFAPTPATLAGPLANIPFIKFGIDLNFPSIGVDNTYPQGRAHQTWEIQESLSHSAGRHTIKAGVDMTVLSLNDTLPLNTRGTINYNSGGGYSLAWKFYRRFYGRKAPDSFPRDLEIRISIPAPICLPPILKIPGESGTI